MDRENLALDIDKEKKAIADKIQEISTIAQRTVALKEQTDDFSLSDTMAESRTSYALSLYSKITNISWDYAVTGGESGRLAGCKCVMT